MVRLAQKHWPFRPTKKKRPPRIKPLRQSVQTEPSGTLISCQKVICFLYCNGAHSSNLLPPGFADDPPQGVVGFYQGEVEIFDNGTWQAGDMSSFCLHLYRAAIGTIPALHQAGHVPVDLLDAVIRNEVDPDIPMVVAFAANGEQSLVIPYDENIFIHDCID